MKRTYHVLRKNDRKADRKLGVALAQRGQPLLGMLDLVGQCRLALDNLMYETGRAQIELLLETSAEEVAGPRSPGRKREVRWYGRQRGRVCLRERKLAVMRPRLRRGNREVPIPAYEQCQRDDGLADRMLDIVMRGVSTRQYKPVLPEMAESVPSKPRRRAEPPTVGDLVCLTVQGASCHSVQPQRGIILW